jgi:hypothetical protein
MVFLPSIHVCIYECLSRTHSDKITVCYECFKYFYIYFSTKFFSQLFLTIVAHQRFLRTVLHRVSLLYFQRDQRMEIIKENLSRIRVPGAGDKVFKDECFYSFDSPV